MAANTLAEVAELLAGADADRKTVELRGGGSKVDVGRREAVDITLDLTGFSAVTNYDPPELVLMAGAGARLSDVEALLADSNQMLAFEPADYGPLLGQRAGHATLGGVLNANASGPRRIAAGAARDHFLGFDGVSGRGVPFKAGGPVVKNVTGFDLPKLIAGSWGTLAALTAVTVKVLPRPPVTATLIIVGLTDREAARVMNRALGSSASVSGATHLPADLAALAPIDPVATAGGSVTALRLEGVGPSIEARIQTLRRLLDDMEIEVIGSEASPAFWRHIRDVGPFVGDTRPLWRISAPPADGWRIVEGLGGQAFYDWAGGLIWLAAPDADPTQVRAAAQAAGGHAMLFRAPAEMRATTPTLDPRSPSLAALSARVKMAFDPGGVLSPGRFASTGG
ncbi:MAG: FAD-binding protein [Caulobacteraceae bacterium]